MHTHIHSTCMHSVYICTLTCAHTHMHIIHTYIQMQTSTHYTNHFWYFCGYTKPHWHYSRVPYTGEFFGGRNWWIWQIVSYSPLTFTENVRIVCQFFFANSFYLYDSPKLSPAKIVLCMIWYVVCDGSNSTGTSCWHGKLHTPNFLFRHVPLPDATIYATCAYITQTGTHSVTHAQTHTRAHTCIHTHVHAHVQTHTHTRT